MEIVLGVKRELIEQDLIECGFFTNTETFNTINNNLSEMNRDQAEQDPSFKQIIPYLVIQCNNKFLLYKRTKKQSEGRLHSKLSLGIGGHINPIDTDTNSTNIIFECLLRELNEEISIELENAPIFRGFINDDTNEVGSVHLGVVYFVEAKSALFEVIEKDKIEANWVDILELTKNYPTLESWSQIVFKNIIDVK